MRYLYSFIYTLILPLILLRFLWRSRNNRAYRERLKDRLGFGVKDRIDFLIHAVSLGEVIAATPLIKGLQDSYPKAKILVTTTTPTGSTRLRANFDSTVNHCYWPLDIPFIIKRFLKITQPRLVIIMETELWPNFLHYCHRTKIPICLANARVSSKAFNSYKKISKLTQKMLQHITLVFAQNADEAARFAALGALPQQIIITGNIKFDLALPYNLKDRTQELREIYGERLVWVAGSTHEGEEAQILKALQLVREILPNILLILVPRHPERFNKVASFCESQGFKVALKTLATKKDNNVEIIIGNTVGELLFFYAAADVAFVGGSLVPVGGHNLLEPAAVGTATITGKYMHNFTEITNLLIQAQGVLQIDNFETLAEKIILLLNDSELRQKMCANAQKVLRDNSGALCKQLDLIKTLI